MPPRATEERISRAYKTRDVSEKLQALNDPDVLAWFREMDQELARQILELAIRPGDEARIKAMERKALNDVWNLITSAPSRHAHALNEIAKLSTKDKSNG